uniref:Ligand-binding protein SH3 n=1 Tax=candidate division WOR-3 bacterium TaxID=2052148 RepID=A0A7C2K2F0_UNCW3
MTEKIISYLSNFITSKEVLVFVVSMLPVVELRGAIPIAVFQYNFPLYKAFALSVVGNVLITVPLVFMIDFAEKHFRKFAFLSKLMDKVMSKAYKRKGYVEKYEFLGLFLFVAIPLPGTGAWTGAIIAYLLSMNKWFAFFSISLGVLVAGILVSFFTSLGFLKGLLVAVSTLFVINRVASYFLDKFYKRA